MAAVVAAPGGDDLLHALHGAAVAHQPWMVLQPGLLLAWTHAYAGKGHQQRCFTVASGLCQVLSSHLVTAPDNPELADKLYVPISIAADTIISRYACHVMYVTCLPLLPPCCQHMQAFGLLI